MADTRPRTAQAPKALNKDDLKRGIRLIGKNLKGAFGDFKEES